MVDKTRGRLSSLKRQATDPAEAEEWQAKGNSLLTMPKGKWHRGLRQVEVPDWSRLDENGNALTWVVELEPEKDFQENAKLCFKKARKITRAAEKVSALLEEQEKALERWRVEAAEAARWREELASGGLSSASEAAVLRLHTAMLDEGILKPPAKPEPALDPEEERRRAFKKKYGKDIDCFRSPGGHEVVAGRSSKMNEYVSLKLARGDMPWFHTDNRIPGSHVLIRAPWDDVAEEDFEFAAKIAAYHSKAKNDFSVPVMYCRGDQVKKIRGAKQGQVTVSGKSYQIFVAPGLPEE